jgi:hypothetical protein
MYQVKLKWSLAVQVATKTEDKFTQCDVHRGHSIYQRKRMKTGSHLTYDDLIKNYLCDKLVMIEWLKGITFLARKVFCPVCSKPMEWTSCNDRSDGFKYVCHKSHTEKQHWVEHSIRNSTWFEKSNLTMEESTKLTYWWYADLDQLCLSSNTIVDWRMLSDPS